MENCKHLYQQLKQLDQRVIRKKCFKTPIGDSYLLIGTISIKSGDENVFL